MRLPPSGDELGHGHRIRNGFPVFQRRITETASQPRRPHIEHVELRQAQIAHARSVGDEEAGVEHNALRNRVGPLQLTICGRPLGVCTWTVGASGPASGNSCRQGSTASCKRRSCPAATLSFSRASTTTEPG